VLSKFHVLKCQTPAVCGVARGYVDSVEQVCAHVASHAVGAPCLCNTPPHYTHDVPENHLSRDAAAAQESATAVEVLGAAAAVGPLGAASAARACRGPPLLAVAGRIVHGLGPQRTAEVTAQQPYLAASVTAPLALHRCLQQILEPSDLYFLVHCASESPDRIADL